MKFVEVDSPGFFENRVTIVVNSCDDYSDVLELFFKAFQEYWPDNIFPVVVNSESSPLLGYDEAEKRAKPWGERLIDILSKIETQYVIMLFDDFVLEDTIDSKKINGALNLLDNDNQASVFYLNAACVRDHEDDHHNDYRLLKDKVDYRLNSVPSIWKREDLISFTKPIDNPWSWEVFGSYRTFNKDKNFYSTSSQAKNIFNYNYKKGGAIYRGKWVREVVGSKIEKYNLKIDLDERGFVDLDEKVNRSLRWKIDFLILGYRSIGFGMCRFVFRYFKLKLKGTRL